MKTVNTLLLLAIGFLLSTTNIYSQSWMKVNGPHNYINDIYFPASDPAKMIVSSNTWETDIIQDEIELPIIGNGFMVSTDGGENWVETKLDSFTVYKVHESISNPDKLFASARRMYRGGVSISNDGGETWSTAFLSCDGPFQITNIIGRNIDGTDYYFSSAINTSEGFKYTTDDFETCKTSGTLSIQARDISISNAMPGLIFMAGDDTSPGQVWRSTDYGQTWQRDESGLEGLRILSIQASSVDPALVFCGADSMALNDDFTKESIPKGMYRSLDTGKTWHLFQAEGYRVFDISEHPLEPKYIAAACGEAGVMISGTFGQWWETTKTGLPNASIRKVEFPRWSADDGVTMYAGTHGYGLYRSGKIVSVDEMDSPTEFNISSVYPQPAKNYADIRYSLSKTSQINISIVDYLGKEITILENSIKPKGKHITQWQINSVASGVYFVKITADNKILTKRIIVNH